jgi:hypothetical protein
MKKNLLCIKIIFCLTLVLFISDKITGQAILKHSYTFDDGTANDVVGTVNGVLNGTKISIANGKCTVSGATTYTDGYISLDAAALALKTYSAVTIEAYIQTTAGANGNSYTMLAYFGNNTGGNKCLWIQSTRANSTQSRAETNNGVATRTAALNNVELDDGKLHHVVVVLTNESLKYYLDGFLASETKLFGTYVSNLDNQIANIFKGPDGWKDPNYNASLDKFNIYDGELSADTISKHANEYVDKSSNSRLASISPKPMNTFNSFTKIYYIPRPAGATSINIEAIPCNSKATVTGAGNITIKGRIDTVYIKVLAENALDSTIYTIYLVEEKTKDCYTPIYNPQVTRNLAPDPECTDLNNWNGWGTRSILYNSDSAYCGISCARLEALDRGCKAALDVSGFIWKPNTTYRLHVMVKTIGGSIGFLAKGTANIFGLPIDTYGEWKLIDTSFTTGANPGTNFFSFNTCDFNSNCIITYIDNYEFYELSNDATLSDIKVNNNSISGFSSDIKSYIVVLTDDTTNVPEVTAIANHAYANVNIKPAANIKDSTVITVTAQNNTSKLTYVVKFSVQYVPSNNSLLSDIKVNGITVSGFNSNTFNYNVKLPAGTTDIPTVVATPSNSKANVQITNTTSLPGTTTIVVTAENGTSLSTYTINFTVKSTITSLKLQHSYTFEDGTANDTVSTNPVNGILQGDATIADGKLKLSGGFASLSGKSINVSAYNGLTVEAVFNQANGLSGFTTLYCFGAINPSSTWMGVDYLLYQPTRNDNVSRAAISCLNYSNPWATETGINASAMITDTVLHHVVTIVNDTAIIMYLDGILTGYSLLSGSNYLYSISSDTAFIGASVYTSDPKWKGTIEELNIYEGTMDAATVSNRAAAFMNASDARLSTLTVNAGTLTPAFDALITHYAIEVPSGTTTVNVTAVPFVTGAKVTGDGAINISAGPLTDTIKVTSFNNLITKVYTIDIKVQENCFTPLYSDNRTNYIPDPNLNSLNGIGGWGQKRIVYGFEAYCGISAVKLVDANGSGCTAALDLSNFAWKSNTVYRVRAMVKTVGGSIGILARGSRNTDGQDFGFAYDTKGEWKLLDTTFLTGTAARTGFFSFNTCDFGSNCTATYIDNYELYELSNDATLTGIKVNNVSIEGFSSSVKSYVVQLPAGTTQVPVVTATAKNVYAKVNIKPAADLNDSTTIVVTAEDNTTKLTYVVKFTVQYIPSDNSLLSDIKVNGTTVSGFNSNIFNYDVVLPAGTTDIPTVVATPADSKANANITNVTSLPGTTTIVVTAENGTSVSTYTINFTVKSSVMPNILTDNVIVYPFTTNGDVTILINGNPGLIKLYDLTGNLVLKQQGIQKQSLSIPKAGMYILTVECDNTARIFKVVRTL